MSCPADSPFMTEEGVTVWDAVSSRRSVRAFEKRAVEKEKLMKCLEAARLAPSWANKQCWHFVLVNGADRVAELGMIPSHIKDAPALIVACGDPEKSGDIDEKKYYLVDVAIAVEHIVLQAVELGLGTVWVGAFKEDKIRTALGIPRNIKVVAILPIGYPAAKEGLTSKIVKAAIGSKSRKEMGEIVHFDKW